jgi:hypothetical protein
MIVKVSLDSVFSVSKDPERTELNEDSFDRDMEGSVFALADGASESYDSQTWARMLVHKYVENPNFNGEWVSEVQQIYQSSVDFNALSWSKQLAYERGSFATLLGLKLSNENKVADIFSVGDSLAVHIRDGVCIRSFPFQYPEQFDARPELLSTLRHQNKFTQDDLFVISDHSEKWDLMTGDLIFMFTDAIGQWFLRELNYEINSVESLKKITTEIEFQSLILAMRGEKRMKLDDSTLLKFIVESDEIRDGVPEH